MDVGDLAVADGSREGLCFGRVNGVSRYEDGGGRAYHKDSRTGSVGRECGLLDPREV